MFIPVHQYVTVLAARLRCEQGDGLLIGRYWNCMDNQLQFNKLPDLKPKLWPNLFIHSHSSVYCTCCIQNLTSQSKPLIFNIFHPIVYIFSTIFIVCLLLTVLCVICVVSCTTESTTSEPKCLLLILEWRVVAEWSWASVFGTCLNLDLTVVGCKVTHT